ncbi:MAG: AAA family ATPase, partial [Blastocatellia bacterium]
SEVFDLTPTRSREADQAVKKAIALQSQERPQKQDVESVSEELVNYLSADDQFWPRWLYFAEQHGVEI